MKASFVVGSVAAVVVAVVIAIAAVVAAVAVVAVANAADKNTLLLCFIDKKPLLQQLLSGSGQPTVIEKELLL